MAPVPSAAAPCPTGRITIEELEITTTPEKIRATGYLVNRASDEVLAASWDPPMIYGLNTYGAWITILSNGTLQGPPTANGVSPHDFVLKPGQRAKFVIEEDPYLHATPARWYAVPQGLIWNTMPQCGSPAATYPSPAHAG